VRYYTETMKRLRFQSTQRNFTTKDIHSDLPDLQHLPTRPKLTQNPHTRVMGYGSTSFVCHGACATFLVRIFLTFLCDIRTSDRSKARMSLYIGRSALTLNHTFGGYPLDSVEVCVGYSLQFGLDRRAPFELGGGPPYDLIRQSGIRPACAGF